MQAAVPSCAPDARRWSFEAVDPGELAALEVALVAAGGLGEEGAPQARKRRGVLQALVNTQAEPSAPEAQLPRFCAPHVRVEVAATAAEVDAAVQQVYAAGVAVTGWDVEWPVSFVAGAKPKPIALMQFALPTAPPVCYLLHVAHSGITPALRALLEDAAVRKVGVASLQDAQKVARDFNITCSGVLDLSELANRSLLPPMRWSLAALVARVLRCQLPKPAGIRIGAWDARTLGKEQLDYAYLDAFASLRVWEELSALPPLLPAPAVAPPAFAHAPRSEETAAAAFGWVPALSAPAALMHSKQETLRLHLTGMGVIHIAAARGIKDITVQNYLGDAMCANRRLSLCLSPPIDSWRLCPSQHCWALVLLGPARRGARHCRHHPGCRRGDPAACASARRRRRHGAAWPHETAQGAAPRGGDLLPSAHHAGAHAAHRCPGTRPVGCRPCAAC